MPTLHITEEELARDLHGYLEKAREGDEIVVQQRDSPCIVLKPAEPIRRTISEVMALMERHSDVVMDEDFARDVQAGIDSHREPLDPPAWD